MPFHLAFQAKCGRKLKDNCLFVLAKSCQMKANLVTYSYVIICYNMMLYGLSGASSGSRGH